MEGRNPWKLVDRLLPADVLHGDPETRQTGRLTVAFSLALTCQGPIYIIYFLALGAKQLAFFEALATLVVGLAPLTFRLTRSVTAAANQVLAGLWIVLVIIGVNTGGIDSPATPWHTLMPAFGMLLVGPRLAIGWTAVSSVTLASYVGAELFGFQFARVLNTEQQLYLWSGAAFTIVPLHLGLVSIFYAARSRMLEEVATAQKALLEAHHHSNAILNTIEEGLLLIAPDGQLLREPSHAAVQWFGRPRPDDTAWTWLRRVDRNAAELLEMGWEDLVSDLMPRELLLEQLQLTIAPGGQHYAVRASLVAPTDDGTWSSGLLVIQDITAEKMAERTDGANREMIALLEQLGNDRAGLLAFVEELEDLVEVATDEASSRNPAFRAIHTIKGSASLYGAHGLAEHCHQLETILTEEKRDLTQEEIARLREQYEQLLHRIEPLVGRKDKLPVALRELEALAHAIRDKVPYRILYQQLQRWLWTSLHLRLQRIGMQAQGLALRLSKGELFVEVEHNELFERPNVYSAFWSVLGHVIRNAVDHGIETPQLRKLAAKGPAKLSLKAELKGDFLVVQVQDNGGGVRWGKLRARAQAAGLPHDREEDLIEAMFSDCISTADVVTALSGRGVGMAAVQQTVRELGGTIEIESKPNIGTVFVFSLPAQANVEQLPLPEIASRVLS